MNYLKKFETHTDYETYINGSDKVLPNVSYCEGENEVHYSQNTDPRLIIEFNINTTSSPTYIMDNEDYSIDNNYFTQIEIDGIVLPNVVDKYIFSTLGKHVVKYTLSNPLAIEYGAFKYCNNIEKVIIPKGVKTLGGEAFSYCKGLKSIGSIGSGASIEIPDTVTTLNDSLFDGCTNITDVELPDSITTMDVGIFSGCTSLRTIKLSSSITTIDSQVFYNCFSLVSINITKNITLVESGAFEGCKNIVEITVDKSNQVYDSRNNCNAIIETGTNTLITGCKNTFIPYGVETIGEYAFSGCVGLSNIIIPNSVTSIENNAFYKCRGLLEVTIGNSVATIGEDAFNNCSNLTTITSLAASAPEIESNTMRNIHDNGTLIVPINSNGYDAWMNAGDYYLGKYSWTKVEQ